MRSIVGGALLIGATIFMLSLGPVGILGLVGLFMLMISFGDDEESTGNE